MKTIPVRQWARQAASGHREAPPISDDAFADDTPTDVFISPYDPTRVALAWQRRRHGHPGR